MTSQPAVSVILPAYQAEATIERAARSILAGCFDSIELVIVDDGSTDGTHDRATSIAAADQRVRVIRQEHAGVAAAANVAVGHCRAPLIARMDADDRADPERITRQVELLQREALDLVGSQVRIVGTDGAAVATMRRYENWINSVLCHDDIAAMRFVELPVVNPTVLGRREMFELGFRGADSSSAAFPEDYDWFLRAAASGARFGKVAAALLDWTESADRLTRTHEAYTRAAFDRCRRTHLLAGPLAAVGVVDLWGVGRTGRPWLRWLMDAGLEVRAVYDVNPRLVGREVQGIPVRHPDQLTAADGVTMLVAVGAEGARERIAPALSDRGYVSGESAWFVA